MKARDRLGQPPGLRTRPPAGLARYLAGNDRHQGALIRPNLVDEIEEFGPRIALDVVFNRRRAAAEAQRDRAHVFRRDVPAIGARMHRDAGCACRFGRRRRVEPHRRRVEQRAPDHFVKVTSDCVGLRQMFCLRLLPKPYLSLRPTRHRTAGRGKDHSTGDRLDRRGPRRPQGPCSVPRSRTRTLSSTCG